MNTTINLAKGSGNKVKKNRPYTPYIYGLFVSVVAVAMGVMLINIFFKIQYGSLESEEKQLLTQINSQAEKKVKMQIIAERSKNIQSLLTSRGNLHDRFSSLLGIFPNSVGVTGLDMNDSEFLITLESNSLLVMNAILEQDLPTYLSEGTNEISLVDINSFQAQNGRYTVALKFQFKGVNNE